MKTFFQTILVVFSFNLLINSSNACVQIDSIIVTDVNCETSGSLKILVSNGTGPFEYSIDGGASFQGSEFFENLASGAYDVVVIDANFCTAYKPVQIHESLVLDMTLTQDGNRLISSIKKAEYRWFDCNSKELIPEASNYSYSCQNSGTYMLEVTTPRCIDTSDCYRIDILTTTGKIEIENIKIRNLQDGTFLLTNDREIDLTKLTVVNFWGTLIPFSVKKVSAGISIEINSPPGIYLLNCKNLETQRIIKTL